MPKVKKNQITTIKIEKDTKSRLDHLKEYGRESYDEILKKVLHILNIARSNPQAASGILRAIDLRAKRKQGYSQDTHNKSILEIESEKIKTPERKEIKPAITPQMPKIKPDMKINSKTNSRIIQKINPHVMNKR